MRSLAATLFISLSLIVVLSAQSSGGSVSFGSLRDTVEQAVDTGGLRELSVRRSESGSATTSPTLSLVSARRLPGKVRRERDPQLSTDRLVVVVRDADGRPLSWQIIMKPWFVRLEAPDANGRLTGQTIDRMDQNWSFVVPDLATARSVTLYQPRWTSSEYQLDPISDIQVQ